MGYIPIQFHNLTPGDWKNAGFDSVSGRILADDVDKCSQCCKCPNLVLDWLPFAKRKLGFSWMVTSHLSGKPELNSRRTLVLERIKFRFIFLLFWQVFAYKQLETLPRLHSVTLHLCCLAPSEKSRVQSAPEKPPDLTGSEPRMVCHTLSLAASLLGIGTPNPSPPRMGPGVVTVGSKKHVLGRRRLLGEEACQASPSPIFLPLIRTKLQQISHHLPPVLRNCLVQGKPQINSPSRRSRIHHVGTCDMVEEWSHSMVAAMIEGLAWTTVSIFYINLFMFAFDRSHLIVSLVDGMWTGLS